MIKNTFTVVDLETTGLDPKTDKITEIAAIRYVDGKEEERFHQFINPGRKLEERIVELTGITDEQLMECPYIQDVIRDFLAFETTGILLGHSVLFDFSFLKRAAVNAGESFEKQGIDTLRMARKLYPDLQSRALPFLCESFEIPHHPHRAMSDVEATYELYQFMMEQMKGREEEMEELSNPLPLIYQVKKEQPITKKQKEQLVRFLEHYHLQAAYELDSLTKNEASRYLDYLIAAHGRIPKRG